MKARKIPAPFAAALAWRNDSHRLTRKYDGAFVTINHQLSTIRCSLVCERMRPKSGGLFTPADRRQFEAFPEWFAVHDILAADGTDLAVWTTRARWHELKRLLPPVLKPQKFILAEELPAGSALQTIVDDGGEGLCALPWDAPAGADFMAAKRLETFLCRVTVAPAETQSATVEIMQGNIQHSTSNAQHPMGGTLVALRGGRADQVRAGSILKVEGMGLTAAGRIREPRLCQDTPTSWLVQY